MSLLSKSVVSLYLLFLAVLAFAVRGHLPCYIDASLYAYPDHWINAEAFHKGLLPLWNPYIACGTPHAANWQSACFYPPFWLFNWIGLSNGFLPMAVAHAALAFAGCLLWLRRLKAAPLWCALGALSFAGSAHLTRCWANLPFIATAAWIPWVFWAFHRAVEHPRYRNWFLAGSCLGLQVLAGYPFFTFYTVLFLIAWFFLQGPSFQTVRLFGLTLAGAALATALQWLPFLEMLTYAKPGAWAQYPYFDRPLDYLTLFKPDALGIPGSVSYQGPFANGMFVLYFGLVPLGALTLDLFSLGRPRTRFWMGASLFWLLWMAGPLFPLWQLIPEGLLEWLEPSKAVGVFIFCGVTLVALSLSRFVGNLRLSPKIAGAAALVLTVLWIADLGRMPFLLLKTMPNPFQRGDIRQNAGNLSALLNGGRMLSLHNPGELAFTGTQNEVLEQAFLFPVETFLANSNAVWGLRSADRYLFLQVDGSENLVRYYNRGGPFGGDLLDIAGVRLLLLPEKLTLPKFRLAGKMGNEFLNINSNAADAWRVSGKEERTSRKEILERLSQPGSGWREKVYLEKDPQGNEVALASTSRNLLPEPAQSLPGDDPSRVRFLPDGGSPGYFTWNETYAPGWHAWVDGQPEPILRAYGLFMAVAVKSGGHQVEFRYEPATFRLGLFITLVAFLLFGGMGLSWKK